MDQALETLRVVDGGDALLVVSHQVSLELNTAGFLVEDDELTHLEEVTFDLAVVVIELLATLDATRTLVSLEDDQEFVEKLTALCHQVLLV